MKNVLFVLLVTVVLCLGGYAIGQKVYEFGKEQIEDYTIDYARDDLESEGFNIIKFDAENVIIEKDGLYVWTKYDGKGKEYKIYYSENGQNWRFVGKD